MDDKKYYCGFFRDRPHISLLDEDATGVFLFRKKRDAKECGLEDIRAVRIVEVKDE